MSEEGSQIFWYGSVLLVTKPGQKLPTLHLRCAGSADERGSGNTQEQTVEALKLYADPEKTFWRFTLRLPLLQAEARWQYTMPNIKFLSDVDKDPSRTFYVPAATDSMRIMFHSCNGFSVGTDLDFWSGELPRTA
jgi:hypothetical protein